MHAAAVARLQKWAWILIYVGIVMVAFGLSLRSSDALLAWSIGLPGAVLIVVGIMMIWVRSRIKDAEEQTP